MAAEAGNVGGCAGEINDREGGFLTTDDTDCTDGWLFPSVTSVKSVVESFARNDPDTFFG
jgi:hypothetical protein